MKTILFQGDSITDAGRIRDSEFFMGSGYPTLVAAQLGLDNPGEFTFYNKGISGNRVVDLYARIKADAINLKPDIMSVLIGVNDAWHEYDYQNGVDSEKYFKVYSLFIEEVKEALPDIKIMILEPFFLRTQTNCELADYMEKEVFKRAEKAEELAQKYNLVFVPLQEKFSEAAKKAPAEFFTLPDGVHPICSGHEIIKREWIKAYNTL